MQLLIKPVDGNEQIIHEYYSNHDTFHKADAGLDLFCLENVVIPAKSCSVQIPLGICTEAYFLREARWSGGGRSYHQPTGFYLYPRSSTGSKTPIRLSNSVGIIDAGYRGELMAIVDNVSDKTFMMRKGERYFQLCAPNLTPINIELVGELSDTDRGKGGY